MIVRCIAWGLVLVVGFGVYRYGSAFKNPWNTVTASPVLSMLPVASDGCSKNCEK